MAKSYDVVFIGGGVMACSTAYSLLKENPKMKIAVIEKDPSYEKAASALALGGVRQQFSTAINIRLSRYSVEVYENFGEIMETKFGRPEIDFRQGGYLFLLGADGWKVALENAELQKSEGVEIELLTPDQIQDMLPDLKMDGIVGGTICRRDGILDPWQVLTGYIRKVKEMGAEFFHDEVVKVETQQGAACGVVCKSGDRFVSNVIVNSAGPWSGLVGEMAGVDVPVKPLPHDLYVCRIPKEVNIGLAYTTLPTSTWWFREHAQGDTMLTGKTKLDFEYVFDFTPDRQFFQDEVWPDLAEYMEELDTIRLIRAWRGCYDYNPHDFNIIIGEHPGLKNFYLITGFSGHGLMQAPAAGRGLAELILHGHYVTLDLTSVSLQRIYDGKLVIEKAVI